MVCFQDYSGRVKHGSARATVVTLYWRLLWGLLGRLFQGLLWG